MTSRESTSLRALPEERLDGQQRSLSDKAYTLAFGAIGWPWLLYSLWGGTKASKARLLDRVGLEADALPHLGSWKADTGFLHRIVDAVEELRPRTVVELGAGASSLICGKALQANGGGRLVSYDQHAGFVTATAQWLADHGVAADLRHAPLARSVPGWPGLWYDLRDIPETIDLLIIDGPPWAVHPFVRGAAECLFDRLSPGGMILLDDAARPGERIVARRWRQQYPGFSFERLGGSTKGTLVGRKPRGPGEVIPFPQGGRRRGRSGSWRRAAAILVLMATGWVARDIAGGVSQPAEAASFVDEASASYGASMARQKMGLQSRDTILDRAEIGRTTGIDLPGVPKGWHVADVQVYPAGTGISVALVLRTERGELVSLFASRAETPAEGLPLLAQRQERAVAYWEAGPFAYAVTAELPAARLLAIAAQVAGNGADRPV
ncbi:class I SAM-dependent methyltransferase [Sphingobium sp. CR28]|uniref:class I SAM-dependent methyltransferase n=1 Tax=Sphingobium sp. CR28 TaxID=3400272 RepID=UPI003FED808F